LELISQIAEKWLYCQRWMESSRTAARCSGVAANALASATVRQSAINVMLGPSGKL
jgi:hypothetical protein